MEDGIKKTPFPFIQGTDCCGEVIEVGSDKNSYLLGKRVIVRPCIRENGWNSLENIWMALILTVLFANM